MKIESVTITGIWRNDKNKEGKAYIDKKGRPFHRVSLKTKEHEGYISGLDYDGWTEGWEKDEVVQISTYEDPNYGLQFQKVSETEILRLKVDDLERRVGILELAQEMKGQPVPTASVTTTAR